MSNTPDVIEGDVWKLKQSNATLLAFQMGLAELYDGV